MLEDIKETANQFRPLLEEHVFRLFNEKRSHGDMKGCCSGATGALLKVLREQYPDVPWKFAGGHGNDMPHPGEIGNEYLVMTSWPGGFHAEDGTWYGHYWVEGTLPDGRSIIVDVTADQFGGDPITLAFADDGRYRGNLRDKYDETAWIVAPETYFVDGLHMKWSTEFGACSRQFFKI